MNPSDFVMLGLATGIAIFGWFIRSGVNSMNRRLDRLEEKLGLIVERVLVSGERQDYSCREVEKLRERLENVQSKCRVCNPIG